MAIRLEGKVMHWYTSMIIFNEPYSYQILQLSNVYCRYCWSSCQNKETSNREAKCWIT